MRFSYERNVWYVSLDQGESWHRISLRPSDYLLSSQRQRRAFTAFPDSPEESVLETDGGNHDQD